MFPPSQPPSDSGNPARVLLFPSAGMGHLVPFVRLATALSARGAAVSLLAVRPTVSASESRLLSSLPPSLLLDFPVSPLDPSLFPPSSDPFFLRFKSLSRSAHLLLPLLSGDPPVSSLIVDITVAASVLPFAASANVPCFVLFTSSAAMLALLAAFPFLPRPAGEAIDVEIAGFKIPVTSLPPPLSDPNHLFTTLFVENGRALPLSAGIVVNTFDALEPLTIAALNSGEVVPGLPPVYAVGPLLPLKTSPYSPAIQWLDEQPDRSVVYVSFGSRTAMSTDQIRELAKGLEMSGRRFLWALKTAKVDREDVAVEIEELVG
ncbi:UDP-glycosyltransferase 71B6 [Apostasia shenzhenica]|uniref:UDP-glycosyltransferase 71B6 n=1 Tax=Apostasia shenzhenica TaxID=1088818 RepID=A0A2I0A0T3_9ASPA|nr:UDP-glycosyltransferase 71B6 [Apostasia shenzhenica]